MTNQPQIILFVQEKDDVYCQMFAYVNTIAKETAARKKYLHNAQLAIQEMEVEIAFHFAAVKTLLILKYALVMDDVLLLEFANVMEVILVNVVIALHLLATLDIN